MSAARVTIGGVDVNPHLNDMIGSSQPIVAGETASRMGYTHARSDAQEGSVSVRLERLPWSTCPLPPGPWRTVGAVALGGLILSLIVFLICHREGSSRESGIA
jgi:hypothetical protein